MKATLIHQLSSYLRGLWFLRTATRAGKGSESLDYKTRRAKEVERKVKIDYFSHFLNSEQTICEGCLVFQERGGNKYGSSRERESV